MKTIKVQITKALDEQLREAGASPEIFRTRFLEWKQGDEFGSYFFGKDAPYDRPKVEGFGSVLQHVHLVPLQDITQLSKWNKKWEHRSRKTSDRALVYVHDKIYGFLLLYVLDEPTAHEVCRMATPEDRELMKGFVATAMHFIMDGKVVA